MIHSMDPKLSEVVHGRFQLVGWPVRLVPITNVTPTIFISLVHILPAKSHRMMKVGLL